MGSRNHRMPAPADCAGRTADRAGLRLPLGLHAHGTADRQPCCAHPSRSLAHSPVAVKTDYDGTQCRALFPATLSSGAKAVARVSPRFVQREADPPLPENLPGHRCRSRRGAAGSSAAAEFPFGSRITGYPIWWSAGSPRRVLPRPLAIWFPPAPAAD